MNFNDPEVEDLPIDDGDAADGELDPQLNDQSEETGEEDVGFGDESEDDSAPDLPKRLRDEIKKRDRENAQLRKRLSEVDRPSAVEVGDRPTRDQFDWDDDAYDKAIDDWNERRLTAQRQTEQPDDIQAEAQQDVQRLTGGIQALTYADAAEVTPAAMDALTAEQQFVIASAAKEPAKLIYALGKNPERLKALQDIKNPVKFIAEVARMETQMTTKTRTPPAPENIRRGDAKPSVASDKEEARLEREAQASGDRTALIRYRREKKAA